MAFTSPINLRCRFCGRSIQKATKTHYFGYTGRVRPTDWSSYSPDKPRTRDDLQRRINGRIVQLRWGADGVGPYIEKASVWDGESYMDQFFCRNICAQRMGISVAFHRDLGTEDYHKAVASDAAKA